MCNNKAMGKLLNLWYVEAVRNELLDKLWFQKFYAVEHEKYTVRVDPGSKSLRIKSQVLSSNTWQANQQVLP